MAATCTQYTPSDLDTQRFWDRENTREPTNVSIPDGFPKELKSPLVWKGSDIEKNESDWKLSLTSSEVAAVDAALKSFEGCPVLVVNKLFALTNNHAAQYEDLSLISASTFALPADFSRRLRGLSEQLYNGAGFQIIHGLDPSKYNSKQQIIVYAGISAHVCPQRGFVDVKSTGVLAHIVNVQAGNASKTTAPAYSNVPLSFHTDNCEIMAFFFLDTALQGGQTMLSSIWQTYNELAVQRPELLHTLADPWVLDTFKPETLQAPRHCRLLQKTGCDKVPVLFRFSRYPITGWQRERNQRLAKPTEAQFETADAIQFIAMKNSITLPVVKGDMLLVNDMALFHARTGFDDGNIPLKRHLVKMYFRDPEQGWNIPTSMENEWRQTYSPNQPDGTRKETWQLLYEPGVEELSTLNG
ncbi:hypothetical protein MMC25_008338 [Agyrium rufum]|nr:hypothetical protein [Agyrium rufum]